MGTIIKSIDIKAPAGKVWDVLVNDELNRQWYAEFSEGTFAVTDWKAGSRVDFLDGSNRGLTGKIVTADPGKLLAIEYDGMVADGTVDLESDGAKEMQGATEVYKLDTKDGLTRLDVILEMPEEYADMMLEMWDRAMPKIKELAETK